MMNTVKIRLLATLVIPVAAMLASCCDHTPAARLYRKGCEVAQQPARWASEMPLLETVPDSASYLMGYIYGAGVDNMVSRGRMPELEGIDHREFEKGVAMALGADSMQVSLLYGIMIGLELRGNMHSVSSDIELDWNLPLTFRGFYQGMNRTSADPLTASEAEAHLNSLLRPFFLQGVSDSGDTDR